MEDLKKKINFDPSLLYYSPNNKESEEDEKPSVTNVETYNSTNRKHVCTVCGKRFFSVSALNLHTEHHPPSERPTIENDNDNANLNRKNQYVWNKGIKCNKSECNFIALDAVEYSKHISSCEGKRVIKGDEDISFCELCDSYFSSENHFNAHSILQHPDCDPDISLKEYDGKHTTITDPVSLYVSENNLEEDSEAKAKGGHSKYPDSFISKKKSKEADTDDSAKRDTNTTGEVTATAANEQSSVMDIGENVVDSNNQSVDDGVENSSTEITPIINNSEITISNEFSANVENEKIDEISKTPETSVDEKIDEVLNQDDHQNENTKQLNNQGVSEAKNPIEEIVIDFDLETNDEKEPNFENSIISVPVEESVNETSIVEQEITAVKDDVVKQVVDDNEVTNEKTDVKSSEKNISSDTTESVSNAESADNVKESENSSKDESNSEAEKQQEIKETEHQERYMNVEKMMYSLFNDETTPTKADETLSSQQDENSPTLQDETNPKVDDGDKEFDHLLHETNSKTPKTNEDNLETPKDDSDFEEFDYSRAGKKKYLKSYSKSNKKKIDSNETKSSSIVDTPKETVTIDNSTLTSDSKPITNKSLEKNAPKSLSQKQIKLESSESVNKSNTELNIKERSTRTRKKLILPDYEYDSDYKSYVNSEVPSKRTEPVKRPSMKVQNNESTPKKRGRPRKNVVDVNMSGIEVNESISSTDVSTRNISKSAIDVKEKIESSYLNSNEVPTKVFTPNDTISSIDVQEMSTCSQSSQNDSVENKDTSKSEFKTEDPNDSTIAVKKKRGRPRKIKREMKRVHEKAESSLSTPDKSAEESIFSDLANALLSLGGSVTDKVQESTQPKPASTEPKKSNVIIKRKKLKPNSEVKNEKKISPEPTFEMKNVENDTDESSSEVDDDLSFKDANKFEKEKSAEPMTNFVKDVSLVANVSTPKKRGRPPKLSKTENHSNTVTKVADISPTTQPKTKSLKCSSLDRANQLFKSKLSDRKSVFLKKKLMKHKKIKSHLDAMSFSLLKNNSAIKKRGRPPKILKEKIDEPKKTGKISKTGDASIENHSENEEHEEVVHYIQNQNDESPGDVSNISIPTDDSKIEESNTPKRKKGRPPKDKSVSASGSGMKKKTSVSSSVPEKDLNLNDVKNSRKDREDSPFIYESYHPKKKRPRIESKTEDDIADVKTDDYVPKKIARIVKPKSPPHEPKDETYTVNKDMYLDDMKTRAKYGKLFKKPKSFVYNEKFTDDMMVTCGRCEQQMTFRHYKNCHIISHYYICWIQGEPEININDDAEVIRILQAAITPESLRKKAIRLACEKCGDVRKSVVGYVSHVRFCQKEDKNALFETCTLCGRVLRPSSVRFHYIKFHGISKPKDSSFNSNQNSTLENSQDGQDDSDDGKTETPIVKRYRMGFTKTFLQKKDVINDDKFWTELKTSYDLYMCMGLSCKHMTLSKEDLKSHIVHCTSSFCDFSCSSCAYKTKYENEIIYHSKKKCQDNSDEEKPKEVGEIAERRVSTRKKKRKFKYDSPNEVNETSEEEKYTDQDFDAELISDDEEYLSESESMSRRSRSKRKRNDRPITAINDKLGLRSAFQQYCLGRTDPLRWTVDLRLKLFSSTPLHVHMKVNTKEWETVPSSEKDKYIPAHHKSMRVYFDSAPPSQFNLFQADVLKGIPTCFVGGPVWAMAWAPLPAQITEQILAVSTLQHMNHVVEVNNSLTFPSLIQFWRFNSIDNISNDIQKPTLAWSIAHNYGAIWSMEWCPSGGFNNLSSTCRLGILAAATSAGCVIVYNIPKLENNDISEHKEIVANPKPDLLLKIRNENVQCTRIVWDQNSPHNSIIGGFSDGTVAFWNINTASVLLKKGSVIYPYRTFEAHNTPITALDLHWLSNGRFLLTGATDRVTRYWDLNDLSGPMYEYERTTSVMNATWMQHWIVTANVHDFGTLIGEAGAFLAHPRDAVEKRRTLVSVRDAFWSVSYSLWNDMVAVSSNGGFVTAYAAKHLSSLAYKQPEFEKVVTSTELQDLNDEEKKDMDVDELTSRMPPIDNLLDCTTTVKNSGIRFSEKAKNKETNETISFDMEKSSPLSVNKVCWNQNYNSFNWLAIGYECGFVRVIRVERFDKHYLTKFYKTNENTATLM